MYRPVGLDLLVVEHPWSALPVPHAIEVPDRAPKERYFDPDFYQLEGEQLWPRVWQMACRLEEIPEPGDVVEYEILDQSVIVVRRRRPGGAGVPQRLPPPWRQAGPGPGDGDERVHLPVPRLVLRPGRRQHPRPAAPDVQRAQPGARRHRPDRRCGASCGVVVRGSTSTTAPRRCGQCLEPAATILDAWKVESLRTEWWYACRLPVNWKLAEQAFQEQYHVVEAHPQLVIPGMRYGAPDGRDDPRSFIDAEIRYLRTMSEGMAGMVHANDVRIAEGLRDVELPDDREQAMATWYRLLNDAVVDWHRAEGSDMPDLNDLEDRGVNEPMGYCFPQYFVLPMYSSASSYRFRPLGPEETLMEIWSLTRFPEGAEPAAAHAARDLGVGRPPLAADPGPGLLQPAAPAAGPARQGLRVHAPVRAGRGPPLELRADPRRLPRRPPPREAAPRPARGQRQPPRRAPSSTSGSDGWRPTPMAGTGAWGAAAGRRGREPAISRAADPRSGT